jgi:hypothetical protein
MILSLPPVISVLSLSWQMISDAITHTHTHTHTHTNQKTAFVIAPVRSQTFASAVPCEKRHSFLSFSYVCPEPVLVKCSFSYINGSKRPCLLTMPPIVVKDNAVVMTPMQKCAIPWLIQGVRGIHDISQYLLRGTYICKRI